MTQPSTDVAGEGGDPLPELYRSGRAKQRRARSVRLAAYAVGLVAIVGFALTADWQKIEPERWIEEAAQFASGE